MISIQNSAPRRDPSTDQEALTLDCYLLAIRNIAQYAVEIDTLNTEPHRRYLMALAAELQQGQQPALLESKARLRGLLRDYRDRAAQFLANLRGQLDSTAMALQDTVAALAESDGSHSDKLRACLNSLREIAAREAAAPVRAGLSEIVNAIQTSLDNLRQQHQFTVSQLQSEIRMLHSRVDSLENAAAIDEATRFSSRRSIEEYVRNLPTAACSVLIMKVTGLAQARAKFGQAMATEVAATFARRLRNSIPKGTVAGRWSEQDFLVIYPAGAPVGSPPLKAIAEHLSMPYACMLDGKPMRISLEVSVGILPSDPAGSSDSILANLDAAFARA